MILFVDDETLADIYHEELQDRNLPVRAFRTADDAWKFLEGANEPLEIAIIDVMMPHGELFDAVASEDGLVTGLCLYRLIRQHYPNVPVFILTNRTASMIEDSLETDSKAFVRIKTDTFFDDFADEIEDVYKGLAGVQSP